MVPPDRIDFFLIRLLPHSGRTWRGRAPKRDSPCVTSAGSRRAADKVLVLDGERLARLDPHGPGHAHSSIGQGEPRVIYARRHAGHLQPLVVVDRPVGIVRALVGTEGGGAGRRKLERFDGRGRQVPEASILRRRGLGKMIAATLSGIAQFIVPPLARRRRSMVAPGRPRQRSRTLVLRRRPSGPSYFTGEDEAAGHS